MLMHGGLVLGAAVALAGCAVPQAETPPARAVAEQMGWPCGEGVAGVVIFPTGERLALMDDGAEGYMAVADESLVACARDNGLMFGGG